MDNNKFLALVLKARAMVHSGKYPNNEMDELLAMTRRGQLVYHEYETADRNYCEVIIPLSEKRISRLNFEPVKKVIDAARRWRDGRTDPRAQCSKLFDALEELDG